jgi:hypothetical protein
MLEADTFCYRHYVVIYVARYAAAVSCCLVYGCIFILIVSYYKLHIDLRCA